MEEKCEKGKELFKSGYNCCQAVVGAFCQELDMDIETAFKMASSFGGGMGRLREVCGAVSGMFMVAGAMFGYSDPKDYDAKKEHYRLIQTFANEFKKQNGSIICRELLNLETKQDSFVPQKRTNEYYQKRPCEQLVGCACTILDEYIKSNFN